MLALALAALLAPPTQVAVLTREAALQRFRERGFDRVLADVQVEAARADATSAGASPNPTLSGSVGRSFGYDAAQCPGCSAAQVGVGLSDNAALWDLVVGKKALRAAVAQASVQAAQHNRDAALRTLTAALLQQFYAAVQAERLLAVAEGARESSARTRALLQRRFAAGASSEVELARAEVQEMEALQARDQAQAQLGASRATLGVLLGESGPLQEPLEARALDLGPLPALDVESLAAQAQAERPDVAAAQAQLARARTALSLARRQRIPDVAVSANYAQEGTGQGAIQPPTLTLGVSVPLPLFYQQQGEVARAEADLRGAQVTLARARAQAAADVRAAMAALEAARSRAERRVEERARRARDLVQLQWEKGAASQLELLDAQRTLLQVSAEHLQDLTSYWMAVAQLELATGKEIL
ncbi:MAG: TolC family protein [Deltaproteobacteria bacterium]|nr:MAG: TolC family protein [Deltaproteobacteria bacterium]